VNPGVAQIREDMRTPGRALFMEHKCVVCHGADGGGGEMGPGLGAVAAEYLAAAAGDREAALGRLMRYLREPQGVPTLRRDSTRYPNPMPSAAGLGLEDEARLRAVAEYVLGMKPASTAVGGDASGR
jgi:mono/diheme cytochrome c family protein